MERPKKDIIKICKKLHKKNFIASCDGNISTVLDSKSILITPSGYNKGFLREEDLVLMDCNANTNSSKKPSSEWKMHVAIYKNCPKAKAVVHAHPPIATAWSIAYPQLEELPCNSCSELILAVGKIPIVPYARPASVDMTEALSAYLPYSRVMILSNHGAISWGESLMEAYNGIERLEHAATMLMYAKSLNRLNDLPADEIEQLKKMRQKIGEKTL